MVRAERNTVTVSDLNVGRKLVGSWTLDLDPPTQRNLVAGEPGAQLEANRIDSAGRRTLILAWSLQS